MTKLKGNKIYFKNGKVYAQPKFPEQIYETDDKAVIDFLVKNGHEILATDDKEAKTDVTAVDAGESTADVKDGAKDEEFGLKAELKSLDYSELKEKATGLGYDGKMNAKSEVFIDFILSKVE